MFGTILYALTEKVSYFFYGLALDFLVVYAAKNYLESIKHFIQ